MDGIGISNIAHQNDCPVCTNHYSVYFEAGFEEIEFNSSNPVLDYGSFEPDSYLEVVILHPSNKGPPAMAI